MGRTLDCRQYWAEGDLEEKVLVTVHLSLLNGQWHESVRMMLVWREWVRLAGLVSVSSCSQVLTDFPVRWCNPHQILLNSVKKKHSPLDFKCVLEIPYKICFSLSLSFWQCWHFIIQSLSWPSTSCWMMGDSWWIYTVTFSYCLVSLWSLPSDRGFLSCCCSSWTLWQSWEMTNQRRPAVGSVEWVGLSVQFPSGSS